MADLESGTHSLALERVARCQAQVDRAIALLRACPDSDEARLGAAKAASELRAAEGAAKRASGG